MDKKSITHHGKEWLHIYLYNIIIDIIIFHLYMLSGHGNIGNYELYYLLLPCHVLAFHKSKIIECLLHLLGGYLAKIVLSNMSLF